MRQKVSTIEFEKQLTGLDELQGRGIHAKTQVCRLGAVVKEMAEMGFALGAGDFRPSLTEACVHSGSNIFFRNGRPETWPSGA